MTDYVLGAGRIYFDQEDANGNLTGEKYFAETPNFALSVASDNVELWSSDGPIQEKLEDAITRVTRNSAINVQGMDDDVMAMFVIGTKNAKALGAASIAAEAHTAQQGKYIQLGQDANNPTGVRNITNVAVKGSGGTPTYALTTGYTVDLALGRLYIVPGGTIANDTALEVDYDTVVTNWTQVESTDLGSITGAMRFIADNSVGANRDVYIPKCRLSPNGELAFKSRDTWQVAAFNLLLLKRTGRAQVYIDGRPA